MKRSIYLIIINICITIHAQNSLPIIKLTGNFGYDYQEGTVTILYPDGSSNDNLSARIKWRGGTTNVEGKHKRNYKIKFNEDHNFFGMRNDNNWILDAGQADVFRLRNRIATELWNDFARKPYYINEEPKALSAVRGEVVEVYLNDEYMGIYSFTECMDRKQMKLKKFENNGLIHGTLWKTTGYGSSMMYQVPDSYDNTLPTMDTFEAKYPELDDLPETDYSTIWNAINFVVNSSDDEFRDKIYEYFDIPVIIDYYLFVNVLSAIDNIGKNMYWAVYDKQVDKKITPAVWDLDLSVGSHYLEHYAEGFSSPEFGATDVLNIITRMKELDVDNFNSKVKQRYAELRKSHFSPDNLIARYQAYYDLLKRSGAANREAERWSGDTDILGATIDFDAEILYISDWITKRIKYLDEKIYDYHNSTNLGTINRYPQPATTLYNINGYKISKYNNKGIYIINGKKIIQH